MWNEMWNGNFGAIPSNSLKRMAGTTGLEPAASAVTGQRSNQLNYVPSCFSYGLGQIRMFTVYPCCQPFRLLQSAPPNMTNSRHEKGSMKNRPKNVRRLSRRRASVHALC
jgi:hypothetical protein